MSESRNYRFFVALANQAISSLTNFVFLLHLVRVLSPSDFGVYSIAFAVLLGAGAVLQGFFLLQMITQLPTWQSTGREHLVTSVLGLQVCACLFLCLAVPTATHFVWQFENITTPVLLTAASITAHAIKEFLVRYFFTRPKDYTSALYVNCILAVTLWLVVRTGPEHWTSTTALSSFFSAHLSAAALALGLARLPLSGMRVKYLREAAVAISPGGFWASASALIYTVRASAHTFIVSFMLGPADVGRMNAARVLVTPATIIIPSLSNVILPEMVRAAATAGVPRVQILAVKASSGIFVIALIFSAVLMLVWEPIQTKILGVAYGESQSVVALWCIYAMVLAIRSGMEWGLQALKKFRLITRVNAIGTTVTLALVLALAYLFGISGAIIGAIIGEITTAFALIIAIARTEQALR